MPLISCYTARPQSPFLKSIFARRDVEPLYVGTYLFKSALHTIPRFIRMLLLEIPSKDESEEKPHGVPEIVVTPSTPTEANAPSLYPHGRLPRRGLQLYEEELCGEDFTLKPVPRFGCANKSTSRLLRVSVLLAIVAVIIIVHIAVVRSFTAEPSSS